MLDSLLRVFGKQKAIESPLLNRLGVQPARTALARLAVKVRPSRLGPSVAEAAAAVARDGFVLVRDYLPADRFARLRDESAALFAETRCAPKQMGPNTLLQVPILEAGDRAAALRDWIRGEDFLFGVLEAVERRAIRRLDGHRVLERLVQGDGGALDPETELHSDTYFSTHKAWLYLTDVALENAPLSYVPASHRLSLRQLGFVYRESVGRNLGSRRISREELGDRERVVFTCAANTLVIADTFGFHARLRGAPGAVREAIQISVRSHPFRPFQSVA